MLPDADEKPLVSDASSSKDRSPVVSSSAADATPKEARSEPKVARAAAEGHSRGEAAVPEEVSLDEPEAPSAAKPANEPSEKRNAPAAKAPASQHSAEAAVPTFNAEQSEPRMLKDDDDAHAMEEQSEKPSANKERDQEAQAARDGGSLGGKKDTQPEAKPGTKSEEAADGEPTCERVSVPGFKLAEGADPAVGGSRRSADMREKERKAESQSESPSGDKQAGQQGKHERSTEEREPGTSFPVAWGAFLRSMICSYHHTSNLSICADT